MGQLGILARGGAVTAGEIAAEADLLHNVVRALAEHMFEHEEAIGQDLLSDWRAFIKTEDDFYGETQSLTYTWTADEEADRDIVLSLEDRYNDFEARIKAAVGGAADTVGPGFSDPADPSQRTPRKTTIQKLGDQLNDAADALKKPALGATWDVILAVGAVAAIAAGLWYMVARHPAPLKALAGGAA